MNDLLTKSWNITDKYEIKEVLGEGMASCVKRCICKSTGAEFAVKIINIGRDTVSFPYIIIALKFLYEYKHRNTACKFWVL